MEVLVDGDWAQHRHSWFIMHLQREFTLQVTSSTLK